VVVFSAQWGFHPGGWGKPPLDEYNRPLYGDVFGVLPKAGDIDVGESRLSSVFVLICPQMGEPIDKNLWGELEPEEGEFTLSSLLFFH
jgi:splicing factor 3B subunit 2